MLSQKLKELSDKLNITKLEDWYSVDAEALTKAGGKINLFRSFFCESNSEPDHF